MSAGDFKMNCGDVGPLLVFLACDEVTAEERAAIEAHLAGCGDCRELLSEEGQFQESVSVVPQAADELDRSGTLLAQCRSELAESLDEIAVPAERERWQPFGLVRRWMALRPGWSAAGLLAAGAILGVQLLQWLPTSGSGIKGVAMNVSAAPRVSDDQLTRMAVYGINFAPSADAAPGTLQVQLRAEQPVTLSGSLDDADVRRVLTYVVRNSEREALRDVVGERDVRDALLESLNRDSNPGVRVEAVNLLVRSLELESLPPMPEIPEGPDSDMPMIAPNAPAVALTGADPSVRRVVRALEELQHSDPNRYVRLRSAAALRQIGPPDVQ